MAHTHTEHTASETTVNGWHADNFRDCKRSERLQYVPPAETPKEGIAYDSRPTRTAAS